MKKNFISICKIYVIFIVVLLILTLIFSLIVIKNNLSNSTINYVLIGLCSLAFFILGTLSGNHFTRKGFLYGLLFSIIFLLIVLIFSILNNFKINFINYLIYIISASIGGMVGVNIKKMI